MQGIVKLDDFKQTKLHVQNSTWFNGHVPAKAFLYYNSQLIEVREENCRTSVH